MQDSLLSSLLKAKTTNTKEIEQLIEEFLAQGAKAVHKRTENFLSDLMVYIMQNKQIDKEALLGVVEAKLKALSYEIPATGLDDIYTKTATKAAAAAGATVAFTFDTVDTDALKVLNNYFTWVNNDTSFFAQNTIKTAVKEAFEGKIAVQDLGDVLRERFGDTSDKAQYYYQLAADQMIRRVQNVARIYQYEKYGVTHVQIDAVVDDDTSDVCRSLNGKIIELKQLKSQADAIVQATSIEQMKQAAPWHNAPIYGTLPKGVGLAPFHARCRTQNIPYFGASTQVDGKEATGSILPGEKFGKKTARYSHVDKTGVERIVTKDYQEHSKRKKPRDKDVIAGMNSINRIGTHGTEVGRSVSLSDNSMVMVYDGKELLTAVKFENKKEALAYFKRNTIQSKMEVIKWNQERWRSILDKILSFAQER